MRVFLIDNNTIIKYNLPSKIDDTFLITHNTTDNKEYLITFVGDNNNWYLRSNGTVNVVDNDVIDKILVEPYKKYQIKVVGIDGLITIYFFPDVEVLFKLSINDLVNIVIGNSNNCNICYKNGSIDTLATIKKINDSWVITASNNKDISIFKNNERLELSKLNIGDIIFIDGLRIVWMDSFVSINNPLGLVSINGLFLLNEDENDYSCDPVSEEDKSVDLYKKNEYFSHIPVMKSSIENKEIVIDRPPEKEESEKLPFLLSLGSSFVMIGSSFMMGFNIYNNINNGKSINQVIPQIVMLVFMIIGSLLMPRLIQRYNNKKKKEKEALRQKKYMEYLSSKERELELEIKEQLQILNSKYLSVDNCLLALDNRNSFFWSREYNDDDFLTIRVGIGKSLANLTIKAPEKHFSLIEDNLLEYSYQIKNKFLYIENAPITTSLKDNNITSLVVSTFNQDNYINGILLQLLILHSSMDLKIAVFTNEMSKKRWEFLKYTPHIFSNDKSIRFFSTNEEEAKYISNYLVDELKEYREQKNSETPSDIFVPYYLVIVDDFNNYKTIPIINEIVKNSDNCPGFSLLAIGNSLKNVPASSKCFVEMFEKDGVVLAKETGLNSQKIFNFERIEELNMKYITKNLINIPVITEQGTSVLPTSLGFLEMFGVYNIEQLNVLNRWQTNNPIISLETVVGVHPNGDKFKLDLHEKYHGPHGLIAGSTGSGKSEFIITWILSMAINYHPYEVQFVLIDYKGGGLAGAFENKEVGLKLPHLVGTITNLDINSMNRSLMSIQSEVTRRQRIFSEVRETLGEGTIDIYKYQKLYREGTVKRPMAHLFIICDEFAELKQQQPDFMDQLISISRIGRSLGVHLILATQKPSGVVNDQIWANSKFKVCLKVQDKSDSMEMLKRPEAAMIKETGRFYLQVGYNELFEIGQSGWSGKKYTPSDKIMIKRDESINYINNVGYTFKTIKEDKEKSVVIDIGDELINLVKYLNNLGYKENINTKRLWLDALPATIDITELKNRYNYIPLKNVISPVIGEYDDPVNQIQNILTLNLSNNGNTIIYGTAGSGKENLLTNIIRSCIIEHSPDEVNIYAIDCGGQTLGIFNMFPHVGDVITIDDNEQVNDLVKMLEKEIDNRKILFQDYSGNYNDYITNSDRVLPLIVVIINNYDSFQEAYDNLFESLQAIYRDGSRYGIVFVLTAVNNNSLKQRVVSYFKNVICLHMNDKDDYRMLVNSPKELIPADCFGRGLIKIDDRAFEFQSATFAEKKDQIVSLRNLAKELNEKYTTKSMKIPTIPKRVLVDSILPMDFNKSTIPIGYNVDDKNLCYYDFQKNRIASIVYSNSTTDNLMFVTSLTQLLEKQNNVIVFDFNKALGDYLAIKHIINNDYDGFFKVLNNRLNGNKRFEKDVYLIIVGINKIEDVLSEASYNILESIIKNINNYPFIHIIIYDQANGYKNIKMSSLWQYIDINNYIFLGDGISVQGLFNAPNIGYGEKKNVFPCMAYVVKNGKYEIIKHVVDGEAIDE